MTPPNSTRRGLLFRQKNRVVFATRTLRVVVAMRIKTSHFHGWTNGWRSVLSPKIFNGVAWRGARTSVRLSCRVSQSRPSTSTSGRPQERGTTYGESFGMGGVLLPKDGSPRVPAFKQGRAYSADSLSPHPSSTKMVAVPGPASSSSANSPPLPCAR
jgi:hypothetical protein